MSSLAGGVCRCLSDHKARRKSFHISPLNAAEASTLQASDKSAVQGCVGEGNLVIQIRDASPYVVRDSVTGQLEFNLWSQLVRVCPYVCLSMPSPELQGRAQSLQAGHESVQRTLRIPIRTRRRTSTTQLDLYWSAGGRFSMQDSF
jgi:hypothetical protein